MRGHRINIICWKHLYLYASGYAHTVWCVCECVWVFSSTYVFDQQTDEEGSSSYFLTASLGDSSPATRYQSIIYSQLSSSPGSWLILSSLWCWRSSDPDHTVALCEQRQFSPKALHSPTFSKKRLMFHISVRLPICASPSKIKLSLSFIKLLLHFSNQSFRYSIIQAWRTIQ